jgi:hypothetical protein
MEQRDPAVIVVLHLQLRESISLLLMIQIPRQVVQYLAVQQLQCLVEHLLLQQIQELSQKQITHLVDGTQLQMDREPHMQVEQLRMFQQRIQRFTPSGIQRLHITLMAGRVLHPLHRQPLRELRPTRHLHHKEPWRNLEPISLGGIPQQMEPELITQPV